MDEKKLLSKNYSKKKLLNIAEHIQDDELAKSVNAACMDIGYSNIINNVVTNKEYDFIVTEFFKEFPKSDMLTNTLLAYKGLEGSKKVLTGFGDALHWLSNLEILLKMSESLGNNEVLDTFKLYQGVDDAMDGINTVARTLVHTALWTGHTNAVVGVAKTLKKAHGSDYVWQISSEIMKAASLKSNGGYVLRVSEQYSNKLDNFWK